jgi:uncharacterized protein (TIGR00369 family)
MTEFAFANATTSREAFVAGYAASRSRTVAGALGIDLVDIDPDTVTLRMTISDASRQPFGLLHGGVSMVLAESAASLHACWGVDLSVRVPVGIEINGSHVGSATEGTVEAVGRVLRRGRTLVVHEVQVTHVDTGRTLCIARVTNLLRARPTA